METHIVSRKMKTFESGRMDLTPIERYYRFHARIYDLTRWSFLFQRTALIQKMAALAHPERILEVGCGTGKNLNSLHRTFPGAKITGLDLSGAMLDRAAKTPAYRAGHVTLCRGAYDKPVAQDHPFDLIVFSYALSMFNPGWDLAIKCAREDLIII